MEQALSPVRLIAAFRKLNGASQSTLILADDGRTYVAKLWPNPLGSNVLGNEAIGGMMMRATGIECPQARPLIITRLDIERSRDLWMTNDKKLYKPEPGVHLAIPYLSHADYSISDVFHQYSNDKVRNSADFLKAYLFDFLTCNTELRHHVIKSHLRRQEYTAHFIDNGCLFGGPSWTPLQTRMSILTRTEPPPAGLLDDLTVLCRQIRWDLGTLLELILHMTPREWFADDLNELQQWLYYRVSNLEQLFLQETLRSNQYTHNQFVRQVARKNIEYQGPA